MSGWKAVEVADSIPGGDIFFILKFSLVSRSLKLGGALAKEIKYVHSFVLIVVLDQDTINHARQACVYL